MDLSRYLPHAMCLLYQPVLIAIHVVSDTLIFGAYTVISALLYQTKRSAAMFAFMRDIFQAGAPGFDITRAMGEWSFAAFGSFIFFCGLTHLMDIVVLWWPLYWLQGFVKVVTAIASVSTAAILTTIITTYLRAIKSVRVAGPRT